jgi:divinyl protochlorophyllide a 8-vinyl-reductase
VNVAGGRIGPNAIIRVAEVLRDTCGRDGTAAVFAAAGISHHLERPPTSMVDELEVTRLHRALRAALGTARAREVGAEAGRRTADYLLAHRIPHRVQWLLRHLPAGIAARLLIAAIGRHAWTFAGSGRFGVVQWSPLRLQIVGNPLCRELRANEPVCDYYSATFERLFRVLVHPDACAREVACESTGAPACVFELRWR